MYIIYMLNILEIYFKNISKYPLLTKEQEIYHFKEFKHGNVHSFNILILCNLRLVINIAKKYKQSLDILDCVTLGNLGLIDAIYEFDLERGFKFSTYATWWIHKTIREFLYHHNDLIKQPIHFYKLKRALNNFYYEDQKFPTIEQLMKITKLEARTIAAALETNTVFSLDSKLEDKEHTHHEIITLSKEKHEVDLDFEFLFANTYLTQKEKDVVALYFGFDEGGYQRTLKEVSEFLEISTERVRQIKEQALSKFRKTLSQQKYQKTNS